MRIIKTAVVTIAILFVFYMIGLLIKKLLKRKQDNIFNILLNGFITTIALFEIMTLPFSLLKLNIRPLYYISIFVYSFLIIISFVINRKEIFSFKNIKNKFKIFKGKSVIILTILAITLIGGQVLLSTYLNEQNADDAFYVSWSQEAKQFEDYLDTDPSTGLEGSNFSQIYRLNSWEIFTGFLARTFNIETSVLAHTIYQVIFIMLAYMAYYLLLRKIDKKHAIPMLLVLALLFLFSGFSDRFRGYALLMRIWQGKTILTSILIPYILYNMVDLHLNKYKIILLIIANIATIALNPIAMWMFPFLYFFFAIVMLIKKQYKNMFKMIIVIIPYILILPIYLSIAVSGGAESITSIRHIEYMDALKDTIGKGYEFVIMYLLSFAYIIKNGSKRAKTILTIVPIISLVTLLNPIFLEYVQKYVTAAPTYWRIFWIIPLEVTICYAIVKFISSYRSISIKIIITALSIGLIVFTGTNMYISSGEFSKHINSEKIPQYIIDETKFLISHSNGKIRVLAPEEPYHGATIRQLSSDIILLISRKFYLSKNNENNIRKIETYDRIYSENVTNEDIYNTLNEYSLDCIIINKDYKNNFNDINEEKAKIIFEDDNYCIIVNPNSKNVII